MILNLLRVETLKVEDMIKRSFSENASQRVLPDQQKEVQKVRTFQPSSGAFLCFELQIETALRALPKLNLSEESEAIREFYDISAELVRGNQRILKLATSQQQGSKTLGSGRVVVVSDEVCILILSS
jgi:antiviral helicase SKI2